MWYQLASRREEAVTVDGLGVLQPGEVRDVTEQEAENFRLSRGLTLAQAGLPEGVDVIAVVTGKPNEPVVAEKSDESVENAEAGEEEGVN